MSIRLFMVALLTGVFMLTVIFTGIMMSFFSEQLLPLLTDIETSATLQTIIVQNTVLSFAFSILLLGFVFWAVGQFIGNPLRRVAASMKAFAETGSRTQLPKLSGAPKEVRQLASVFETFADSVESSHKRDVEISRVKSDFISTAAHQLRTPLTGIRWALEALQLEQLTESQKALVASAVEKSHQLVAVVGTLLDISSIESGKYKYDFKVMPLDGVVEGVTRDFQALAAKSNTSLLFEKSGTGSAIVRIDAERIRWVLNNLIENAIRYTPAGGQVRVTTELAPERAYVRVRDTGIGIAPEDRGNIFERFYRAPNAIAKENGGNGLGLYIARTVATDHGGDLNFQSNEGGTGTTFTLSLPLAG